MGSAYCRLKRRRYSRRLGRTVAPPTSWFLRRAGNRAHPPRPPAWCRPAAPTSHPPGRSGPGEPAWPTSPAGARPPAPGRGCRAARAPGVRAPAARPASAAAAHLRLRPSLRGDVTQQQQVTQEQAAEVTKLREVRSVMRRVIAAPLRHLWQVYGFAAGRLALMQQLGRQTSCRKDLRPTPSHEPRPRQCRGASLRPG